MSANIMNGTALATRLKDQIACEVKSLDEQPGLAVILVGDSQAAQVYADGKRRDCLQCGFHHQQHNLPENITEHEMVSLIQHLNQDEKIHGILVEMPLPRHLDEEKILSAISPAKDIDCMSPQSCGQILLGADGFPPCTPAAVMEMLKQYEIPLAGKHCVVVGRSNIVGKPLAMLLLAQNATVTICHSKTENLGEICRSADVILAAVGREGLITGDMVKEGAVVIDIAMNRNAQGKLCGDVVYDEVVEKASYITPVPGGVGPMTRVLVLKHLLSSAKT